jgi:hypothetical protein
LQLENTKEAFSAAQAGPDDGTREDLEVDIELLEEALAELEPKQIEFLAHVATCEARRKKIEVQLEEMQGDMQQMRQGKFEASKRRAGAEEKSREGLFRRVDELEEVSGLPVQYLIQTETFLKLVCVPCYMHHLDLWNRNGGACV